MKSVFLLLDWLRYKGKRNNYLTIYGDVETRWNHAFSTGIRAKGNVKKSSSATWTRVTDSLSPDENRYAIMPFYYYYYIHWEIFLHQR